MAKGKGEKCARKDISPRTSPNQNHSASIKPSKNEDMDALTRSMNQLISDLQIDREERKKETQTIKDLLEAKQRLWDKQKEEIKEFRKQIDDRLKRLENAERRKNFVLTNFSSNELSSR